MLQIGTVENLAVAQLAPHVGHDALPQDGHAGQVVQNELPEQFIGYGRHADAGEHFPEERPIRQRLGLAARAEVPFEHGDLGIAEPGRSYKGLPAPFANDSEQRAQLLRQVS